MKRKNLSVKKKIHNFYSKKLKDPRIKRIYINFKKKISSHISTSFCIAVSGGVDSMALSFLAKCYSLENNKKVYFFIVDHKLRKNSTFEANLVKKKLNEGLDEKQIYAYLKNKYGDWILYDPGFSKNTYFLWLLPILMFIFGGAIILSKVILKKKNYELS